jgi:aryl-alcohol dehydrogenase-like predicted oxidoreductase
MKYTDLKCSDLKISSIALGTWVFGGDVWGGASEKDCIDAVAAAIDHGINLIDTAPIYGYGQAESIVGKAIKGKRDKVIVATKCGLIGKGGLNITNNLTPESIQRELDESLSRLGTDYIDIYQCHWPDPNTPIEDTLEAMMRFKEAEKIRHIGVSNFDTALLKESIAVTEIVTLQNQYSMLVRDIEKDVLPFCKESNVGVISYGPLAGGILSGKYSTSTKFKGPDARSFFYKFYSGKAFEKTKRLLDSLKNIGQPLNQIAINWVRQQDGVASVIVGCRNAEQVEQNALAASWDLSADIMADINDLISI